jgi:hypothetical protein
MLIELGEGKGREGKKQLKYNADKIKNVKHILINHKKHLSDKNQDTHYSY